jgi:hypothetical protein
MSFTYTTGIPNPPNDPSVDVPNMQTNTNTINSWTEVDHIGFNNGLAGQHTHITFPNVQSGSSSPFSDAIPKSQIFPQAFASTPTQELYYADTQAGRSSINRLVPTCAAYGRVLWNLGGLSWTLQTSADDIYVNVTGPSITKVSNQSFAVAFTTKITWFYSVFFSINQGITATPVSVVGYSYSDTGFSCVSSSTLNSNAVVTFMVV